MNFRSGYAHTESEGSCADPAVYASVTTGSGMPPAQEVDRPEFGPMDSVMPLESDLTARGILLHTVVPEAEVSCMWAAGEM